MQHSLLLTLLCLHCRHRHLIVAVHALFLPSFLLFILFHFPTEIYPLYSIVETSVIDLKLSHKVQNGLNSHSKSDPRLISYGYFVYSRLQYSILTPPARLADMQSACQPQVSNSQTGVSGCSSTRMQFTQCKYMHHSKHQTN